MFGFFFENSLNIVHLPREFFNMFLGIQDVVIFNSWLEHLQILHILQRQSEIALLVTAKTPSRGGGKIIDVGVDMKTSILSSNPVAFFNVVKS